MLSASERKPEIYGLDLVTMNGELGRLALRGNFDVVTVNGNDSNVDPTVGLSLYVLMQQPNTVLSPEDRRNSIVTIASGEGLAANTMRERLLFSESGCVNNDQRKTGESLLSRKDTLWHQYLFNIKYRQQRYLMLCDNAQDVYTGMDYVSQSLRDATEDDRRTFIQAFKKDYQVKEKIYKTKITVGAGVTSRQLSATSRDTGYYSEEVGYAPKPLRPKHADGKSDLGQKPASEVEEVTYTPVKVYSQELYDYIQGLRVGSELNDEYVVSLLRESGYQPEIGDCKDILDFAHGRGLLQKYAESSPKRSAPDKIMYRRL